MDGQRACFLQTGVKPKDTGAVEQGETGPPTAPVTPVVLNERAVLPAPQLGSRYCGKLSCGVFLASLLVAPTSRSAL